MTTYHIALLCTIASVIIGNISVIRYFSTIKTAVVIYSGITWLLCVFLTYYRLYGFSITLAVVHIILHGIGLLTIKPNKS